MPPNSAIPSLLLRLLYRSWQGQELNDHDQQQLDKWLASDPVNRRVYEEVISGKWPPAEELNYYHNISEEEQWERLMMKVDLPVRVLPPVNRFRRFFYRWSVAAILVGLASGIFYIWQREQEARPELAKVTLADITPGRQGAVLTLADGSVVPLDSLANGVVASQQGTQAILSNGQLSYQPGNNTDAPARYNTVTTPNGRQFNLILPDGSHAWLNARSSIRYPVAFNGEERSVEITGEVYLEIAQDEQHPFYVKMPNKNEIAVLGTRFNINAYADEPAINTTLLDGAVRVATRNGESATLKPGQTARLTGAQQGNITIVSADIEKVMAWKNGAFNFEGASLEEVMRQLARWYDIEVIYMPGLPDIHFGGKMSRDVSLAGVLRGLELMGVHFKLEDGRRLIVYK